MKTIITLTALLTASPALASDGNVMEVYKQLAINVIRAQDCNMPMTREAATYASSIPSRMGAKPEYTTPIVAGMVFAYRDILTMTGEMGEFCKAAYMER